MGIVEAGKIVDGEALRFDYGGAPMALRGELLAPIDATADRRIVMPGGYTLIFVLESTRCMCCDKLNTSSKPVWLQRDPFAWEVDEKEVMCWLCFDCEEQRRDDI